MFMPYAIIFKNTSSLTSHDKNHTFVKLERYIKRNFGLYEQIHINLKGIFDQMIGDKMIRPSDLNKMIYDEMVGNKIICHRSSVYFCVTHIYILEAGHDNKKRRSRIQKDKKQKDPEQTL